MKSEQTLQNALKIKEKDLVAAQEKVAGLDAWITANNVFKADNNVEFLEKVLTEKVAALHRQTQLEEQIKILKWVLTE